MDKRHGTTAPLLDRGTCRIIAWAPGPMRCAHCGREMQAWTTTDYFDGREPESTCLGGCTNDGKAKDE